MNDTTIIKTISKVHSIIIDLLILVFIILFSIYFTLHIGLKLDKLILPGLQIEQLYIKWDEKIAVNIDSIKITKSNTQNKFDFKSIDAKKILKQVHLLNSLFSDVQVRRIVVNDVNATFSYSEHHKGYVELHGPTLKLVATIDMNDHIFKVHIKELSESSTKTTLSGTLVADTNVHHLYGDINTTLADVLPLHILLLADRESLKFWSKNSEPITKDIDPLVKVFNLGPLIEPWIADYLLGDELNIEYMRGTLLYDDPISILDTIDIKACYQGVDYMFAPGFEPAHAPKVDLAFKDRILYVYPRNGTFYGEPGGTTWVKIDFEHPSNPLLTVDVDTSATINPELIAWLKGYNIALPFYQKSGKTNVKLAIWITLQDIIVTANGGFTTQKSVFNFSNTDIAVKNVKVNLNNTDVDIYNLNATLLDDAINVDVHGKFNPVSETGDFDIDLNHLHFGKGETLFSASIKYPLHFNYIMNPENDRVVLPKSHWTFGKKEIAIESIVAPFSFTTLSGHIPATLINVNSMAQAYVSGRFNIKELQTHLMVDLLKFQDNALSFDSTNTSFSIVYTDALHIKSMQPSSWKFHKSNFILKPSFFTYKEKTLLIHTAHIDVEDVAESTITGKYNFSDGSGKITLQALQSSLGETHLLEIKKDIKVYIHPKKLEHLIEVPIFNLKFTLHDSGWNRGIKNIKLLSTYSPLLQEYNITSGAIYLRSKFKEKGISLYGYFPYPYPILVKKNKAFEHIKFSGKFKDGLLDVYVNDDINVKLDHNSLDIKADKIGVSIFPIFDFINEHPTDEKEKKEKSNFKVTMELSDSFLYVNKYRRAPADKIYLQYKNSDLKAQLVHGKNGGAVLEFNDEHEIYIYGDHLDDTFMSSLAEFSEFKGGEVSFYISGKPEKLTGIIRVKDTIIKDYKAINNMFALINTIPALVTFSLPHYNAKGLKVTEGYTKFVYENHIMDVEGFHINTPELNFFGKGTIDTESQTVDFETSLVTEATSNLSKIPLLGYILVGKEEDTVTTTMTLKGPMDNPVVKNTLAKDIGVGSFNILFRTLTFPIHYVDKAKQSIENAQKNKEEKTKKSKK